MDVVDACQPTKEICDGLDNDCDKLVDEDLGRRVIIQGCGFNGRGTSYRVCEEGVWNEIECWDKDKCILGETRVSYAGEIICYSDCNIDPFGVCQEKREKCGDTMEGARYKVTQEEVLPSEEICDNKDNDCDGEIDKDLERIVSCGLNSRGEQRQICVEGEYVNSGRCEDPDGCVLDQNREFYSGPEGTADVGECRKGLETCLGDPARWQVTKEEITPVEEICDCLDNNCDGETDEGCEVKDGTKKWEFSTNYPIAHSSPAIGDDGTIYFGSDDRTFYALNPDGTIKWQFTVESIIPFHVYSTPSIGRDGTIYVEVSRAIMEEGEGTPHYYMGLWAIDSQGMKKWEYSGDKFLSLPAIMNDGTILIMKDYYYLYAISPDGEEKWRTDIKIEGNGNPTPIIGSDGTIYVGNKDFYAINPDGTVKWKLEEKGLVINIPSIDAKGTIYFGTTDNKLCAIDSEGTERWDVGMGGTCRSSPAIGDDGTIYIGCSDNKLYAIDPDGIKKWEFETGDDVDSSPLVGKDRIIYMGSEDGKLYAINPDGTKKWEFNTLDRIIASPAIDIGEERKGILYIGSTDYKLYAISSCSFELADSPWPKFRHDNKNTGNVNMDW